MGTAPRIDPTIYPETDHMREGELQQLINELLRPTLARFLAEQGTVAHVGSNTFLYYVRHDSSARVAPDVYVLPGIAQATISRSWKLFDVGVAPSFALEVVSHDREKDYAEAPRLHARIGTEELVIFDPDARGRKGRFVWQQHRRVGGELERTERGSGDRIASPSLGCFLRVVGVSDAQRVRVALGPRGDELFPTDAERADEERAEKDRALAELEAERARRVALEAEVAKLRGERR